LTIFNTYSILIYKYGDNVSEEKVAMTIKQKIVLIFTLLSSLLLANNSDTNETLSDDEIYHQIYKHVSSGFNKETKKTLEQYVYSSYNLTAYRTNYFLPVSYRFKNNYPITQKNEPDDSSPTQTEAEFQISIKYDIGSNLLGLHEIYSFAYTQKSFWQIYVNSAYFRETNYNPEAFVKIPIYEINALKVIRLGYCHESNGHGGEDERSWNYLYSSFYFKMSQIFIDLRLWARIDQKKDGKYKYNNDLSKYIGYGHLQFIIPYEKNLIKAKFMYNPKTNYGNAEINYSYPIPIRDDAFFYVKYFNGYNESLIDYNHHVQKLGFGIAISR
jgi:phospholipase A1